MLIMRIGKSTDRTTQGKYYEAYYKHSKLTILDDKGTPLCPQITNKDFWEIVNEPNQPKQQKNTMLVIENDTRINGKKAKDYTLDEILHFIRQEESAIEPLEKYQNSSKKIDSLIVKHKRNIAKLLVFIDNDINIES